MLQCDFEGVQDDFNGLQRCFYMVQCHVNVVKCDCYAVRRRCNGLQCGGNMLQDDSPRVQRYLIEVGYAVWFGAGDRGRREDAAPALSLKACFVVLDVTVCEVGGLDFPVDKVGITRPDDGGAPCCPKRSVLRKRSRCDGSQLVSRVYLSESNPAVASTS